MYSAHLNLMIKAAEKAARSLMHDFSEVEKLQVSLKGPNDFVSKADHRSEQIIHDELLRARPDYGFLMEERGGKPAEESAKGYCWLVDPLDGTKNFLYGLPHWAVTIALQKEHEIIAGLVFDPIRQEMFVADKGGGAFMNKTRLRVSGRRDLALASVSVDISSSDQDNVPLYQQELAVLQRSVASIRRMGSCALELSYVAAGRYDAYRVRGVKPWDTAAGCLLIAEAGGVVTDHTGQRYKPEMPDVLASTPTMHSKFLELFKGA